MIIEKKSFLKGINSDVAERLLGDGEMLNLMNARVGVTQYGRNGRVENTPGTLQLSQNVYPPYGVNSCIGGIYDEQYNRIIFFLQNSFRYHGIYSLDRSTNTIYAVLYDSQVSGGLNFSKNSLIHSAAVVNGILYWPDSTNNQPRGLHIDAAIKTNHPSYVTTAIPYSFPINFSELTLIKPPPVLAPNLNKGTDGLFPNNFIFNNSFQFAFVYEYYNTMGESVIGAYSRSSRLNNPNDDFNYIDIKMDVLERIPSTVRYVKLVVRKGADPSSIGDAPSVQVIKVWDREIPADANLINNQNLTTNQLTYRFYNNITGEVLAPDRILKQAESIPDFVETLCAAKNRLFFENSTSGTPTPNDTSLSISLQTTNLTPSTLLKQLVEVRHRNGRGGDINYAYSAYYVYLTEVFPQGWYELTSTAQTTTPSSLPYPTLPPAPPTFAFSGLTFRGADLATVAKNTAPSGTYRWDGPFITYTSNIVTLTGVSVNVWNVFKNGGQRKLGVQFYDFAMRPLGGVITNDNLVASIPRRTFTYGTATTVLSWQLSNLSALTEIPENAYYYAVVSTKELLTRYFIESFSDATKYVTKGTNGEYLFSNTSFITGCVGIGLDTTALVKSGLGYSQQENDVAVIISESNAVYTLPVIGQSGNYIIVKAEDIGNLSGARFIYEVYTPYQTSDQEPFFIMGEMYRISNPTTLIRSYEILSDTIDPDCYALTRNYNNTTYLAEAMSPNDLYFQRWDTDCGKLSKVINSSREQRPYEGGFSNEYIPGTLINGLCNFEPLNFFNTPQEAGAVCRLFLTNKIQDKGSVMLSIGSNSICSIYLGETQVSDASGQTKFFAQSDGVVGTINDLKVSYGSIHPESIVGYRGMVYGFDVNNGIVWQYSGNGLFPVSSYNQTRFFKKYAQDYLASSSGSLDAINGFHHIRFSINPFHKELVVSLPGLIYENYAEVLPSYSAVPDYATSIINRFDIADKLEKTMCFKFEENMWGSNFEYGAEWFIDAGDNLYAWKNGVVYLMDADTTNWNTYFGQQRPIRICTQANMNPSALKDLFNLAVESNVIPNYVVALTNIPNQQITDLASTDNTWKDQQGVYYATFLKDRLSPNASGTADQKLYTGDVLTDFVIFVMLELQAYTELNWVQFVDVGYAVSRGQKQIIR